MWDIGKTEGQCPTSLVLSVSHYRYWFLFLGENVVLVPPYMEPPMLERLSTASPLNLFHTRGERGGPRGRK